MSGKKSRDKGQRREREFAALVSGERVPLSGAAGGSFKGDVIDCYGNRYEVKARAEGFSFLYKNLEGVDALALKADRRDWLVVNRFADYWDMVSFIESND